MKLPVSFGTITALHNSLQFNMNANYVLTNWLLILFGFCAIISNRVASNFTFE